MLRPIFAALFSLLIVLPVAGQQTALPVVSPKKSGILPADPIPSRTQAVPQSIGIPDLEEETAHLSEEEILRHLGRIYRLHSDVLDAQADGNSEAAEDYLGMALAHLATLVQQPGIMDRPRFRETYRTLITEYERYYGTEPDTLAMQHGDIFQIRTAMFAELETVEHPLLEDVMRREVRPVGTQIAMTQNRLVEQSIAFLLRNPERHINNWMSRAETYFPMIEQILAEEGAPDELKYLAMIESGLNPTAKSWASAVGMWQFMAATGRAYDLHVNSWIDDRMNPEKATRAAARHMNDLYAMFGDWHLALAAYNTGPGNVRRAQRRSGRTSFWDIYDYLPRETRNYVPMFIATAMVASNPEAFGLGTVDAGPRYAYHYVPVEGMLSISDIARMAGTTESVIRALNPELRRNTLPPSQSAYYVKVPYGTHERFIAEYESMPAAARTTAVEHVVRRGDSLGRIGSRHGVSVTSLMQANNIRSTTIHPGQRLIIPVPAYTSSAPPAAVEMGSVLAVDYGTHTRRPILIEEGSARRSQQTPVVAARRDETPTRTASNTRTTAARREASSASSASAASSSTSSTSNEADTRVVYMVQRGDNLTTIARKYSVSVSQIRSWNNLRSNTIHAGQRLTMYTSSDAPAAPATVTHVVRRGDTLSGLASRYGVSVANIRAWNNLRSNNIRVNQRLTIHPRNSAPITHRVVRGDTLIGLAQQYGVSVSQIRSLNNLRSNTIRVGQNLKISS